MTASALKLVHILRIHAPAYVEARGPSPRYQPEESAQVYPYLSRRHARWLFEKISTI